MASQLGNLTAELASAFDAWGELVRYYPGGDLTQYIERIVIVDRDPQTAPRQETSRVTSWACTIYVRRDQALGILDHTKEDRAAIALLPGAEPTIVRVATRLAVDHGMWTLECLR